MLLTNHVMTGILLGLSIDEPWLLAPAAVASHLAMDVVPHFGPPESIHDRGGFRDPFFIVLGSLDFAASLTVTAAFCVIRPDRLGHILLGASGAALPDLTYIPVIVFGERWYRLMPWWKDMIFKFLAPIQWYEKPLGLLTETSWAVLMLWALGLAF